MGGVEVVNYLIELIVVLTGEGEMGELGGERVE